MRPSAETLLAFLIMLFFLKDSLWLLQHDEAVLVRRSSGRWGFGFGARTWQLSHREPYLLNPFMPHQPAFRLRWSIEPSAANSARSAGTLAHLPRQLALLGISAWISWIALGLLVLALVSWRVTGWPLLVVLGLLYCNILATLLALWRWRPALGLDRRTLGMLAFECLVCPPYAANIVRRVSALHAVPDDFVAAAEALLTPRQMEAARAGCLARIDARMEIEEPGSAEMQCLVAARPRFTEGVDDGQR